MIGILGSSQKHVLRSSSIRSSGSPCPSQEPTKKHSSAHHCLHWSMLKSTFHILIVKSGFPYSFPCVFSMVPWFFPPEMVTKAPKALYSPALQARGTAGSGNLDSSWRSGCEYSNMFDGCDHSYFIFRFVLQITLW